MFSNDSVKAYSKAYSLGRARYFFGIGKGKLGNLPTLDAVICNINVASKISLGVQEIPLKKVIGTYMHSRSLTFACNYMPIAEDKSEFAEKWKSLYDSHIQVGISDPIKVYEYLNWFYVIEGNKRVSVLKYVDARTVNAKIYRIHSTSCADEKISKIYLEFIRFNEKTNIFEIWFSQPGRFEELLVYLKGYKPDKLLSKDKITHFISQVYHPFRDHYYKFGGNKLQITTADALLEFIKLYGIPNKIDVSQKKQIKALVAELIPLAEHKPVEIHTQKAPDVKKTVIGTIANLIPNKKPLKIAFIYSKTTKTSGWTFSHELARRDIYQQFGDRIETTFVDGVEENQQAVEAMEKLAKNGYELIFTTNPKFFQASLKIALSYPTIKVMNCSSACVFKSVRTYFGRIYEPKFLLGMIAGIYCRQDKIAYVAKKSILEEITGINAFALGVKSTNQKSNVKIFWDINANLKLDKKEYEVIYYDRLPKDIKKKDPCGLYFRGKFLAKALWNWSVFYSAVVENVLNNSWDVIFEVQKANQKLLKFWWGMESGLVDIHLNKKILSTETINLIAFIRKMIVHGEFAPFKGPLFSNSGELKLKPQQIAENEDIIAMDWFVKGIVGRHTKKNKC